MMGNLKPYPAYKDSGVEWLGQVPEHWEMVPNRALLKKRKKLVGSRHSEYQMLSLTKQGIIVRDLTMLKGKFSADLGTSQEVRPGDLVFCLFDIPETPRTVGLSPYFGMITGAYTIFESLGRCRGEFIERFYIAMDDRKLLAPLYTGLRNTIPPSVFLQTKTPVPPLPEQTAIVRFLDWADRRIRRVIRARQRRIKLLEEYKQALIHQAVTGRIDVRTGKPYPAYKDSGVEWLGQVPEHWEMVPNRALLKKRKKLVGSRHSEYQMLSLTKQGIIVRDLTMLKGKFSADLGTSQEVRPGDLVFCLFDIPETPRTVGLSPYFGMITGAYTIFEPLGRCRGEFIERFYIAMDDRKLLAPLYTGLRNTIPPSVFLQTKTPVPPLPEQTAIVEYLDAQTAKIEAAIDAARREIELLREYRERLIADVVTGKVDVREVAARLPEEPPEEESEWMDTEEIAEAETADDDAAAEALSEEEVET